MNLNLRNRIVGVSTFVGTLAGTAMVALAEDASSSVALSSQIQTITQDINSVVTTAFIVIGAGVGVTLMSIGTRLLMTKSKALQRS